MKLKQKILSLAIALSLTGSVVPTSAFADTSATQTATFTWTCSHGNHEGYTELSAALKESKELTGCFHLFDGKYYLSSDLTVNDSIDTNQNVEICLNGHTLTFDGGDSGFSFYPFSSEPVNISVSNGKIVAKFRKSNYIRTIISAYPEEGCQLNLTVDNVSITSANDCTDFAFRNNANATLKNCVFENISPNSSIFYLDSNSNTTFENCTIKDISLGCNLFEATSGSNLNVIDTKISNINFSDYGRVFSLHNAKSALFDGVVIDGVDNKGIAGQIIDSQWDTTIENLTVKNCDFGNITFAEQYQIINVYDCTGTVDISNTKIHDVKSNSCKHLDTLSINNCKNTVIKDTEICDFNVNATINNTMVYLTSSNADISGLKIHDIPCISDSSCVLFSYFVGDNNQYKSTLSDCDIRVSSGYCLNVLDTTSLTINGGTYVGQIATRATVPTVYGGNFSKKIPESWLAKDKTIVSTGNKTYPYRVDTIVHKGEYSSDANGHWIAKCTECGKSSDKEPHISDDGKITKQPTTTSTGTKTYTCKVCGYVIKTEEIEKLPIIPPTVTTIDEKNTWADTAKRIEKNTVGKAEIINMNGSTTVPAEVIKAIAVSDSNVTFNVDDMFSWTVDGAKISETTACDFSVTKAEVTAENTPRGTLGTSFTVNDTSVKSQLNINFKATHKGEFANLFKKVDGKLVFVDNVKLDENGAASGLEVSNKGEYVVMLGEFSDRAGDMDNDGITNAKDALAALKDAIGLAKGANPLVSDMNNDGTINAKDALIILKISLGIY